MAVLRVTDSDGNVAEIDIRVDARGTGKARWSCRNPGGAFTNRLTVGEWQEATVKWETDVRGDYVGTACCYLDEWGDGEPVPCLELENVYSEGIHEPGPGGTGTIESSREGVMTEGDVTWQFLRYSGGESE